MRKYGWSKERADNSNKDREFHLFETIAQLPALVDLRNVCPPVYDQGTIGSCTANAVAGAYEIAEKQKKVKYEFEPSRLFIYYNERLIENDVTVDNGAILSDGLVACNKYGVCTESRWPYDITKFAIVPPPKCYKNALIHRIVKYVSVQQTLTQLKTSLANNIPFVFGFIVYSSFESQATAATGIMTMPQVGEKILGGHAVLCVGYNDATNMFTVRNSWGASWGDKGYFYMPYAFMSSSSYCSDFWAILRITS